MRAKIVKERFGKRIAKRFVSQLLRKASRSCGDENYFVADGARVKQYVSAVGYMMEDNEKMKKMKRIFAAIMGLTMCLTATCGLTACKDNDSTEGTNGGTNGETTEITFWYDCGLETQSVYRDLVQTYNTTQGVKDGVKVIGSSKTGISSSARTQLTGGTPPNVIMIDDTVFRTYANDSLFLDLTNYYNEQPGDYTEDTIPDNMTDRFRITLGKNGEKTVIGDGENLYGLPFGSDPNVLYYNVSYFEGQGIHIISVPEDELDAYNKEHGTNFAPHGYAEYAVGYLTGDAATLSASENIAGEQVVKVFNNAVPTNWEEFRYLCKYFTKAYNKNSPTDRAYGNEWWFANGWSVGGDCIGWDGEKYNFTIADDTPNYLVTADSVTINNVQYTSGQIVRYEDKVAQADIATMEGVYEIPSQKDALMEFLCLSGDTGVIIDGDVTGYAIAYTDARYRTGGFTAGESAIAAAAFSYSISFERALGENVDMAVNYQYREYEGGSVYYDGNEDFANEYLKLIGAVNPGDTAMYTGELATDGNTEIVGNLTGSDCVTALVIPARSDSSKYDAAWKFIRWASGPEGQAILAGSGNMVPNQTSIALSDTFYSLNNDKNYYAAALMSRTSDVGDWGYFENGEWVTDWAEDFNNKLRKGMITLSEFLAANEAKAQSACASTEMRIKGWR